MTQRRLSKSDLLGWLVLLGLTGLLFHRTLGGLFDRWWNDPSYGHGLLVPVAAIYFFHEALKRNRDIAVGGSLWGVVFLALSIGLLFAGRLGNMLFVQAVAFIVTLLALSLLAGGWSFLRVAALPVAYLIFMCPLPSGIYDSVSAQLRLFASGVSTILLQATGVPATSAGNLIFITGKTLSVDDACSGIRSLFGILATATAFAFVVPGGALRKSVFVISAAPIAVFTNILRVTGTGLLQHYGYTGLADGFYHYLEGWVFYLVAMVLLFVEYVVLKTVFPIVTEKDKADGDEHGADEPGNPGEEAAK